jgi:uncharacterized membrane protein YciS (DUF1049 family)
VNDRAPSATEYVWFGLKWNLGLALVGLIAFVLFSAGYLVLGILVILLFFTMLVVSWVRLSRRTKRAIMNRK